MPSVGRVLPDESQHILAALISVKPGLNFSLSQDHGRRHTA